MSSKKNIAAQQAFGDAVNNDNLAALDDLVSAHVIDHDPAAGQGPGPQGYRRMFSELRTAFPDLHIGVEHLTADGDDVAFAYTMTNTSSAPEDTVEALAGKAGIAIPGDDDTRQLAFRVWL